jgi:macrolide phosphotransferase
VTPDVAAQLCARAARHGLTLDPGSLTVHEADLDFRVGIGRTVSGEVWVLRVPRRADMGEQITSEAAILHLAAAGLSAAVQA